ncbi:CpaF family protein [Candidatus Woesearchaeota archaeon]|nr:CpaF family protein [Candidatus Woesearchaeota archaeon]
MKKKKQVENAGRQHESSHQEDSYNLNVENIPVNVQIVKEQGKPTKVYKVGLLEVSGPTKIVIQKIKEEIVNEVSFNLLDKTEAEDESSIRAQFREKISALMKEYFGNLDEKSLSMLTNFVVLTSLGFGEMEYLLKDPNLEEVVVNNAKECVRVYHKKHGWLMTNIFVDTERKVRHFATIIARETGKEFSILEPLMDSHLATGDRVNATLSPVTTKGNTITIRKFAEKPWTITDMIANKTIDIDTAAFLWQAMHYELSLFIVGGTGSGKTSMLNVLTNFLPPNQRVISIEDTREIQLPDSLHWVPMETRLPNQEGKGEVSMLDLMTNSLRMRPDRIIVGEIRRKKEAEVLFEAIHTGHSVYATLHASDVDETIARLTNPPIEIPKAILSSLDLMVVQNRNRRTGQRKTFQVAEMLPGGQPSILFQLDMLTGKMKRAGKSVTIKKTLKIHAGLSESTIAKDLSDKIKVLKWVVKKGINDVNEIGNIMEEYYTENTSLMKRISGG